MARPICVLKKEEIEVKSFFKKIFGKKETGSLEVQELINERNEAIEKLNLIIKGAN